MFEFTTQVPSLIDALLHFATSFIMLELSNIFPFITSWGRMGKTVLDLCKKTSLLQR